MKQLKRAVVVLSISFAACVSGQAFAQTDQAASQSGSSDEIVKMRMQIASANKAYDKKVAAAKKVYDHTVATHRASIRSRMLYASAMYQSC